MIYSSPEMTIRQNEFGAVIVDTMRSDGRADSHTLPASYAKTFSALVDMVATCEESAVAEHAHTIEACAHQAIATAEFRADRAYRAIDMQREMSSRIKH